MEGWRHQVSEKIHTIMRSFISVMLVLTCFALQAQNTVNDNQAKMQWFKDAKLGIFIHWGIYSVNGVDESWAFLYEAIEWLYCQKL